MNTESALIVGVLDLRMELDTATLVSSLEPEAFVSDYNRIIWAAMNELVSKGKVIDSWGMKKALAALGATERDHQILDRYFNDSRDGLGTADLRSRLDAVSESYKRRLILRSMESILNAEETPSWAEMEASFALISQKISQAGNPKFQAGTDYTKQYDAFLAGDAILPRESQNNQIVFGLPSIDEALLANPGRLIILGAMPSAGKTALAIQAGIRTAEAGKRVVMASLEMDADEIAARVIACITGYNSRGILKDGCVVREDHRKAIEAVKKNFTGLHGCAGDTWQSIEAAITREHQKSPLQVAIIDYLQLMNGTPKKGETEAQMIGEITKGAKRLAQRLGINVVLVSQFNRDVKESQEPSLQNLLGSGQIERDADIALLLWNDSTEFDPKGERTLNCRIAKNRGGERFGKYTLNFNPTCNRFNEIVRETKQITFGY